MTWTPADDLDLATRHVLQGEARCARLRVVIDEMVAAGQDTAEAEHLLATFEQMLTLMREHQQRLLQDSQTRS